MAFPRRPLLVILFAAAACKSGAGGGTVKEDGVDAAEEPPPPAEDQATDEAGTLPKGNKFCLHSAVRASLATAIRNFSKKQVKAWDDAKGGGVSIDFDPNDKDKSKNGDVHRKLKDDKFSDDEFGGGPVTFANYKVKVKYDEGGSMTVSANFSTETCKTPSIGSKPDVDKTDDEFDGNGKCSVMAMRELLGWGVRNVVKDKDVDSWSKNKGKDLVKISKFTKQKRPDLGDVAYIANVTGGRGQRNDIVVSMKDNCKVKDISADFDINDDD
jgi:hypothetical protein